MTRAELNGVRFLMKELKTAESELSELRKANAAIVPALKELPRGSSIRSKVEALTMEIMRQEERVASLKGAITIAKMGLTQNILIRTGKNPEQAVTLLRFVECLTTAEIRARTGFSLRHINRLSAEFLRKCHLDES